MLWLISVVLLKIALKRWLQISYFCLRTYMQYTSVHYTYYVVDNILYCALPFCTYQK